MMGLSWCWPWAVKAEKLLSQTRRDTQGGKQFLEEVTSEWGFEGFVGVCEAI